MKRVITVVMAMLLGLAAIVAIQSSASAASSRLGWLGPYQIRPSAAFGKCLDVTGVSQANGAPLQLYDCLPDQWNQQFYLFETPYADSWQIVPRHSWKCLDVQNVSYSVGATIQQFDCLGFNQPNQIFFRFGTGGFWHFAALHSSMCIQHIGNGNGASVVQGPISCDYIGQTWYLQNV